MSLRLGTSKGTCMKEKLMMSRDVSNFTQPYLPIWVIGLCSVELSNVPMYIQLYVREAVWLSG